MNEVLLTAGAAAIIIAVVGGGATAFGVHVPVLESRRRQVTLGLVGVAFLAAAVVLTDGGEGRAENPEVRDYRQEVLATCRALPRGEPVPTQNGTFERGAYLDFFTTQRKSWQTIFGELWEAPVPDALKNAQANARHAWKRASRQWAVALEQLRGDLPPTFDYATASQIAQTINSQLAESGTRLERAMSRLAGAPCTPP